MSLSLRLAAEEIAHLEMIERLRGKLRERLAVGEDDELTVKMFAAYSTAYLKTAAEFRERLKLQFMLNRITKGAVGMTIDDLQRETNQIEDEISRQLGPPPDQLK